MLRTLRVFLYAFLCLYLKCTKEKASEKIGDALGCMYLLCRYKVHKQKRTNTFRFRDGNNHKYGILHLILCCWFITYAWINTRDYNLPFDDHT